MPFRNKHLNVPIAFALSGLLHLAAVAYSGSADDLSGVFLFFASSTPVMLMENHVPVLNISQRWKAALGFIWVCTWLYVTLPWFAFPLLRLPVPETSLIPYSFVGNIGKFLTVLTLAIGGVALHIFMGVSVWNWEQAEEI